MSATLHVTDFSCINIAAIELSPLTVIIGPQASGKSVLCKLSFFFLDVALQQNSAILREETFEKFSESIRKRFIDWFPPSAWGPRKFRIQFSLGDYSIALVRKTWRGKVSDEFRIKLSEQFKEQYQALLTQVQRLRRDKSERESVRESFELDFKLREASRSALAKVLGKDAYSKQAFVPAGRSFFTSFGKAIVAFEQGRMLDPLVLRFGRMFAALREQRMYIYHNRPTDEQRQKVLQSAWNELIGGEVKRDGESEFVLTKDGRKIPLSALSSGQQELLPLMTIMPWLAQPGNERLCYIEEPEAHLFPSAQSALIELLVSAVGTSPRRASLVMTTHSPYVLTKINNLLKAGSIYRKLSDSGRKKLDQLIPRRSLLLAKNVRAYSLKNGELENILEADGLINADYLDEVSGRLGEEFSKLLDLEENKLGDK